MTPTGHTDRVQPSVEPRVLGSPVVDLALPLLAVFFMVALRYPSFALGVVIGATTTYLAVHNGNSLTDSPTAGDHVRMSRYD
ncbi:MAG: hypothetical protein ABEH65_06965 [Halobacteriales archaeon]